MAVGVSDQWKVICDTWYVTCDMWHVTCDTCLFLYIYIYIYIYIFDIRVLRMPLKWPQNGRHNCHIKKLVWTPTPSSCSVLKCVKERGQHEIFTVYSLSWTTGPAGQLFVGSGHVTSGLKGIKKRRIKLVLRIPSGSQTRQTEQLH